VLITDEKPDYARLVRKLAAYWGEGEGRLVHLRISSHLPRTIVSVNFTPLGKNQYELGASLYGNNARFSSKLLAFGNALNR